MTVWKELQLAPTRDVREIKRAYAKRLKQVNPADDAEGFQKLRQAYEWALKLAQQAEIADHDDSDDEHEPDVDDRPGHDGQSPIFTRSIEAEDHGEDRPMPSSAYPPSPPRVSAMAAAVELCRQIREAQGKESRTTLLREALRQPEWEFIDFRAALEQALIRHLQEEFDHFWPLIETFHEVFGWQHGRTLGDGDDSLLADLLARQGARKWRWSIEQGYNEPQIEALALLIALPNETAFRRFARSDRNRKAMRELLATLHTTRTDVLHFEANAGSVRWWLTKFNSEPKRESDDNVVRLLGWIILPPILMVMVISLVEPFGNGLFDPSTTLFKGLIASSYVIAIALNYAYRYWAEDIVQWAGRISAKVKPWRTGTTRRLTAIAVTALLVILGMGADFDHRFLWLALPACASLAFWFGVRYAISALLIYAWPLHVLLIILFGFLFRQLPHSLTGNLSVPTLIFPHILACFLLIPFVGFCKWIRNAMSRPAPANPVKQAFYVSIAMTAVFITIAAFIAPFVEKSANAPYAIAPSSPDTRAAINTGSDATKNAGSTSIRPAIEAGKVVRPLAEVQKVGKKAWPALNKLVDGYLSSHPRAKPGNVEIEYDIASDGRVMTSRILSSDYANPALENQLLASVNQLHFKDDPQFLPSRFTVKLSFQHPTSPPEKNASPELSSALAVQRQEENKRRAQALAEAQVQEFIRSRETGRPQRVPPQPPSRPAGNRYLQPPDWSRPETHQGIGAGIVSEVPQRPARLAVPVDPPPR